MLTNFLTKAKSMYAHMYVGSEEKYKGVLSYILHVTCGTFMYSSKCRFFISSNFK